MKKRKQPEESTLPEAEDIASATECTGLMPALPQDAAEAEEAASLYAIHGIKGSREELYRK